MFNFTNIITILAIYFILFLVIKGFRLTGIEKEERKTYFLIGGLWAIGVFLGNFGFYKLGIMSFTPWVLNFLHTFIWIGFVLSYLYMSTRMNTSIFRQMLYFIVFSFIVKYAEQVLFDS